MSKDYYNILGVSKSASAEEIKSAYHKLALKYHPDRGGSKENEAKFKEANEAYQILSDPQKRSQYDQFGDAAFRNGGGQGFDGFSGFGNAEGFDFSGFGFSGGLGDIFGDLFSQSFASVQAELQITPAQAVLGDKLNIDVDGNNLELNIPAGTQSGQSFIFRGKGRQMRNGARGDLTLTIKIVMPKNISDEQKELWAKLREAEKKKRGWWK